MFFFFILFPGDNYYQVRYFDYGFVVFIVALRRFIHFCLTHLWVCGGLQNF